MYHAYLIYKQAHHMQGSLDLNDAELFPPYGLAYQCLNTLSAETRPCLPMPLHIVSTNNSRHWDALLDASDVLIDEISHHDQLHKLHGHHPISNKFLDGVVWV